jgi:hypothetical protein
VTVQNNGFPFVVSPDDYNGKTPPGEKVSRRERMGREPPNEIVLIFQGTHQVMSAEKCLKKAKVPMRLIPVPRRLTSDCGLAIRIFHPDRARAKQILTGSGILPQSVHILRDEGMYEEEPF